MSDATQRWFERLPAYVQEGDNGDLRQWLSLLGDQLGDVGLRLDLMNFVRDEATGEVIQASALVDATQAGRLTDALAQLRWLAQLLGANLGKTSTLNEQIDAVRYATTGWRAGTKAALADAARSVLGGTKYVLIEPHYAGDRWTINIRTRASETPDDTAVVNAIYAKGAKPAGVVLLNIFFDTDWATLEADRPTWGDWDGYSWLAIEETGLPVDDSGLIPPPAPPTGDVTAPFIIQTTPGNLERDVDPTHHSVGAIFSEEVWAPSVHMTITDELGNDLVASGVFYSVIDTNITTDGHGVVVRTNPTLPEAQTVILTYKGGPGGIQDMHGNVMREDYVLEFTTRVAVTAPTVVSVTPADQTANVPSGLLTPITVEFSADMDNATLTAPNVRLELLPAVSVVTTTRSYDSGTKKLTITPTAPLAAGASYQISIDGDTGSNGGGAQDVSANSLSTFFHSTFSTAGAITVHSNWTDFYFNDFQADLDYENDWWEPYDGVSTWKAGTWRPSQIQLDKTGTGILNIVGVTDATKKAAGAKSNLVAGGIALGRKSLPATPGAAYEFKMRMDYGPGFGPAILTWPDTDNWPGDGEDDIIEMPTGARLSGGANQHWADGSGDHQQSGQSLPGGGVSSFDGTQWHIYRHERLADRSSYFIDGVKFYEVTDTSHMEFGSNHHWVAQVDMFLAGMNWIQAPDTSTPAQVRCQIDYIKIQTYTPS